MAVPLKKRGERKAFDVYETPEWAVNALLKEIPVRDHWKYMEPCRGSGRIYSKLPLGSAWGEIRQGIDYLSTSYNPVDVIITNPPYSLAQEFVTKALAEAHVVIMLLRLGFLESMKRNPWWKQNPLTSLLTLSKRPSFTEDGNTDGSGYAWFVWDKKNRLSLKPFYFLEGPPDECRRKNDKDKQGRRKSSKRTGRPVQQHCGGDPLPCEERTQGAVTDDRDTGASC